MEKLETPDPTKGIPMYDSSGCISGYCRVERPQYETPDTSKGMPVYDWGGKIRGYVSSSGESPDRTLGAIIDSAVSKIRRIFQGS